MGRKIELKYSDDMPANPQLREVEKIALADRETLGCKFGQPFNPRILTDLYDIYDILETYRDYERHFGRNMSGEFDGLEKWSGVIFPVKNDYMVMVNPEHIMQRRTFTIAHEFGHLAFAHQPIAITIEGRMPETRYSDNQESEAFDYGLAILLPYAPLLQIVKQGATNRAIAHHFGVSSEVVNYRLSRTQMGKLPT